MNERSVLARTRQMVENFWFAATLGTTIACGRISFSAVPDAPTVATDASPDALSLDANGDGAYVTFLGGGGVDQIRGTTIDAAGNFYFTGATTSTTIAGCTGTNSGSFDVIVGKFAADGSLAWCRLLGGPSYDLFYDIELDAAQARVVVAGRGGEGFPVTTGAWDTTFNASQPVCGGPQPEQDGTACALDATTGAVVWCTYTGFDNGCDFIWTIALDANDDVILGTGFEGAVNDPKYNSLFLNSPGGGTDGIVGKLSADGTTLHWYRYIGGPGDNAVTGTVAVDSVGVYYTPSWTTDTGHAIVNGYDSMHSGGTDQYLARLSLDGAAIAYASYFGGGGDEDSDRHALIASGTPGVVFLKTGTTSTDFPTMAGAISRTRRGASDCGIVKVDTDLTGLASLVAGTYLGGGGDDYCEGAALAGGALLVGGGTRSTDLAVTANALQASNAGGQDGWVAVVAADLSSILYASYLGGTLDDMVRTVGGDAQRVVGAGVTDSTDLSPTPGALQPIHASPGQWDGVIGVFPR